MCTGALMPSDRPIQNRVILFMHGSCAVRIPSLMTHVHFMHACMLTCSVWLYSSSHCAFFGMAFFEQAAVLATAWANHGELKALGAKHSLCVVRSSQLSRSSLHAISHKHVLVVEFVHCFSCITQSRKHSIAS